MCGHCRSGSLFTLLAALVRLASAIEPEWLLDLLEGVGRAASSLPEFMTGWQEYIEGARERVPELTIADDGDTMVLGAYSPGCRACKQGAWDCIFMTTYWGTAGSGK